VELEKVEEMEWFIDDRNCFVLRGGAGGRLVQEGRREKESGGEEANSIRRGVTCLEIDLMKT
jgi:hypothetical protein